ncbi:MAG: hypothetical protein V3U80_00315 [Flavobacteriaceae bacterium]
MNFKILLFIWLGIALNLMFLSENKNIKKSFKKSNTVFVGELVKRELKQSKVLAPSINTEQNYIRIIYTFKVIKLFKGDNEEFVQITIRYKGKDFVKGEKYLVYANLSEYLLTSNFYLNGEKVTPFLTVNEKSRTKLKALTNRKEIKKLNKLARKHFKKVKRSMKKKNQL